MKLRDTIYLSRMTIKNRKKNSLLIILGIGFSLSLLLPLLFIALGFYVGVEIYSNRNPEERTFNVSYSTGYTSSNDVYLLNKSYKEDIDDRNNYSKAINYSQFFINSFYCSLNGGEYMRFNIFSPTKMNSDDNFYETTKSNYSFEVIDSDDSKNPILASDYKYVDNPLIGGFNENNRGEIIVSSTLTKAFNIEPNDIIGKSLSLKVRGGYARRVTSSLEDENDWSNFKFDIEKGDLEASIQLFLNFNIVGVYDERIYGDASLRTLSTNDVSFESIFWITSDSLKTVEGISYCPTRAKVNGKYRYYYSESVYEMANKAISSNIAFIPYEYSVANKYNLLRIDEAGYYEGSQYLEYSGYSKATKDYQYINQKYLSSTSNTSGVEIVNKSNFTTPEFIGYYRFYNTFSNISIILFVFGISVFIATLLNIYNTNQFNIDELKGTIGMYKAIGMSKKSVKRLYLTESFILLMYSYILVLILGVGSCIASKILFDKVFIEKTLGNTGISFTIEWYFLPLSLLIITATTFSIIILMNHLLINKTNRTPITNLLSEENK